MLEFISIIHDGMLSLEYRKMAILVYSSKQPLIFYIARLLPVYVFCIYVPESHPFTFLYVVIILNKKWKT
jgi:hypothetical protein